MDIASQYKVYCCSEAEMRSNPKLAQLGQIICATDTYINYVYTEGNWDVLFDPNHFNDSHKPLQVQNPDVKPRRLVTHCKSCGAALKIDYIALARGYNQCEFCNCYNNTYYWD